MFCASCGAEVSPTGRFCSACGEPIEVGSAATLLGDGGETIAPKPPATQGMTGSGTSQRTQKAPSHPSSPGSSSDPIGGGRFAPGQILAERYRVVALLGRGGMGEVYRAEDLKLAQVVAIKLLPERLSQDAAALERFHAEVRIARQVSHPNVCRVFDIGDADGIPYLTMEYVDGEDLASLVRRVGRLSSDKAVEIARQVCAGLAAAHDRGVVHRDLKPANVMLDGLGKVRITDFGLASVASAIEGTDVRAGTPAYMAPEQLAGQEVTIKSDLYSLGLVMYEILTGKRAYDAATLDELMKLRGEVGLTSPSTLVREIDPLVERVVMRCLERDPTLRPSSALQVAAALPGGDPLAAALAAGETPSPQMVAAAGENAGLSARTGLIYLGTVVIGLCLALYVGTRENGLEKVERQSAPELMAEKAREVVEALGYSTNRTDTAQGIDLDGDLVDYIENTDKPKADWVRVLAERPPVLTYWYRQSPGMLVPNGFWSTAFMPGVVTMDDPPPVTSGMVDVKVDPMGRLLFFRAIPNEVEKASANPGSYPQTDWSKLFALAQLNPAQFHSATPEWTSLGASDTRAAWEGIWPGTTRNLRVEAASLQGKPVFFSLIGPWTKPTRMPSARDANGGKAGQIFGIAFGFALLIGGLWLAYRNDRGGRGDTRGALRLAGTVLMIEMGVFLCRAHLALQSAVVGLTALAISTGLFIACLMYVLYLALEPYVRRHWPQTIISWSRLLDGRLRDPLVGRDVLSGIVLGMAWVVVYKVGYLFDIRAGAQPQFAAVSLLLGTRDMIGTWLVNVVGSILGTLMFFLVLVLLRAITRNRWVAAALFVAIFTLPKVLASSHPQIDAAVWAIIYAIAAIAVVRYGLVVLALASFTANVLLNVPYTVNPSAWYASNCYLSLFLFLGMAIWAFYRSLGGAPIWKNDPFA